MTVTSLIHRRFDSRKQGFTLIELLMVIAVILILASITFGISRGVRNAQSKAKAKAELATIAQGIEQFKLRYGDYPWHIKGKDTNTTLVYALTGRLWFERDGGKTVVETTRSLTDEAAEKRPKFIDLSKFSVSGDKLIDPWGYPYVYIYKWDNNPGLWETVGFHLYSSGPNGDDANDAIKKDRTRAGRDAYTGVLESGFREVADAEGIIFAGE